MGNKQEQEVKALKFSTKPKNSVDQSSKADTLTDVHFVVGLGVADAFELELLQWLWELLDGHWEICGFRGNRGQSRAEPSLWTLSLHQVTPSHTPGLDDRNRTAKLLSLTRVIVHYKKKLNKTIVCRNLRQLFAASCIKAQLLLCEEPTAVIDNRIAKGGFYLLICFTFLHVKKESAVGKASAKQTPSRQPWRGIGASWGI